jgi:hypothetical protein
MKLLKIATLSATLLAAGGCAGEMAWQRVDGGPINKRAFAWAAAECRERAREEYGHDATERMQRCMQRRGYVWTAVAYDCNGGYGGGSYNGCNGYNGYNGYNGHRHHHDDDD